MPTLLATSPLAATRSQPTITASAAPRASRPAARRVDDQLVLDPKPRELLDGQPRALQQRARLGGQHFLERAPRRPARRPPPARSRGPERRARRCCNGSGSAVRRRAARRRGGRSRRWRPAPRPRSRGPRRARRRRGRHRDSAPAAAARTRCTAHARLTAVGRACASSCAGPLERVAAGVAGQRQGDAVPPGDPDQRRAADRQALDRVRHVLGGPQSQLALRPGQRGLVDRPQGPVLEAQRDHRVASPAGGGGHRPML